MFLFFTVASSIVSFSQQFQPVNVDNETRSVSETVSKLCSSKTTFNVHTCDVCLKTFPFKSYLKRHMFTHVKQQVRGMFNANVMKGSFP